MNIFRSELPLTLLRNVKCQSYTLMKVLLKSEDFSRYFGCLLRMLFLNEYTLCDSDCVLAEVFNICDSVSSALLRSGFVRTLSGN